MNEPVRNELPAVDAEDQRVRKELLDEGTLGLRLSAADGIGWPLQRGTIEKIIAQHLSRRSRLCQMSGAPGERLES